jgi:Holliday junction resolvase RusA-like endonuclease
MVAIQHCHQRLLGPVMMTVDIYRGIPKSWSKTKQEQAERGIIKPTLKPDVDNYVKAIKDALNGIAYVDDSQVTVLLISKYYDRVPRVEIKVEEDVICKT